MVVLGEELNLHIEGSGDGLRRVDALWRASLANLEDFRDSCMRMCLQLISAPEGFVGEARAVHFMGVLVQRTPAQPEAMEVVVEGLATELTEWATTLEDPLLRTRSMILVKEILHGAEGRLSQVTTENVLEPLLDALNDKVAKIRKLAVLALSKAAQSEEYGPRVVEAYTHRLDVESNQAVRVAAAQSMPQSEEAYSTMLVRTHDVSPEVRAAVYAWFGATPVSKLSVEQRVLLLTDGLKDRTPAAKEAAASMAGSWLTQHCGGDCLRLLAAIDVQQNQGVAHELLEALVSAGALNCVALLQSGALGSLGNAAAEAEATDFVPTTPELAFAWTFLAHHLHTTARAKSQAAAKATGAAASVYAAAASDSNNLLEAFLPESARQLASLVHAHLRAGEQHKFAVCQVLGIAGLAMDWTDGTSREVATDLVHSLMESDFREGARPNTAPTSASAPDAWAWQHAVISFASKVLPNGKELLGAVLPTLRAFIEAEGTTAGAGGTLQCLAYASQLLQCLPKARLAEECEGQGHGQHQLPSASLQWFLDHLLLPNTQHTDVLVRGLAMRCVGMYPLLPMGTDTLLPAVGASVRLLSDAAANVKKEAAKVLLNLLLVFGMASVNDKACLSGVRAMHMGVEDLAGQLERADIDTQSGNASQACDREGADEAPTFDCLQLLHSTLAKAKKQRLQRQQQQQNSRKRRPGGFDELGTQEGLICAIVDGMARLALFQELHEAMQARQQQQQYTSSGIDGSGSGRAAKPGGRAITDEESQRILDRLLLLYRDPAFEDIAYAQQILGTFFEAYCRRAAGNKRRLAQALPNTFNRALGISVKGRKTAAPGLVKFALELLLIPLSQQQQQREPDQGTEQLCQDVLQQLHNMPDAPSTAHKEFYRELSAMLSLLPFNATQHPQQLQCCLLLLNRCTTAGHLPTADRTLVKNLVSAKARFEGLTAQALGPDAECLSEEEMEAMLQQAKLTLQSRHAAQQRQAGQISDDDDSGEGDGEEGSDADSLPSKARASKARAPAKRAPAPRSKKGSNAAASTASINNDDANSDVSDDEADSAAAPSRDQSSSRTTSSAAAGERRQPMRGAAAKARQQLAATAEEEGMH